MELSLNISIVLSTILSLLFSVVAYFIKQLHHDFRKVEQDIAGIRISTEVIKANIKSAALLSAERITFLEKRIDQLENPIKQYEKNKTNP